ncbi:nonsense-mediated mRNA decay factor SMG8 [Topomyia yanbarensis]|uniref:nonsense-mediated mRNA decay factor SMG8 n=1 Tax=Topomyia yanbarensis TaxID=2498891 RepID=UPI00273CD3FA|nr:nonsense-mediated mRNA decay factor SMG8 [Topomyia yanbarensis]XP_058819674.1 nonsense-mediated mRNA decay factor SMG8 [Topomyia yanbarensis]
MNPVHSFSFPEIPKELSKILFKNDKQRIIVGVIGKSSTPDCNKLVGFDLLTVHPALTDSGCCEGRIKFYFENKSNVLFLHFETTFDQYVMGDLLARAAESGIDDNFVNFNSRMRTRFARMLLFAIQVCHMIVLVEPTSVFDTSYLSIFKSLKIIREKYVLKFLPKLLKNSSVGNYMGKEARLCSPRFIFFFEGTNDIKPEDVDKLDALECSVEDDIYKMLRNEFIITNNSAMSLFSIPRTKKFVFFNSDSRAKSDPLIESIDLLMQYLDKPSGQNEADDEDLMCSLRPYDGYGVSAWSVGLSKNDKPKRSILALLKEHVSEAFEQGFDDSMSKYRGRSHFVIPGIKTWFEGFKLLHKIFIENFDNSSYEADDLDYKAFLENFHKIIDIDERFFAEICEHGLELAMVNYKEMLPHHYSSNFHEKKHQQAHELFIRYARGPEVERHEIKLRDYCDSIWLNGKQQCEYPSLRGNPCALGKHKANDPTEHSSGMVFVSACNCGRTQGHREDPYTIRQANYEFYQIIAKSCSNCNILERIKFPIFEPSSSDFRAAEFINKNLSNLMSFENSNKTPDTSTHPPLTNDQSPHLSGSQKSQDGASNLTFSMDDKDEEGNRPKTYASENEREENLDHESINEIVIKVGEHAAEKEKEKIVLRQPSTTEYLPGMLHAASPAGLLPQFPSWSLLCLGPSSIYTHNSGIPEHVQSGFLSGANFLLPWDVSVRLEHAQSWAASYEKIRNRKKNTAQAKSIETSNNFTLKIFIGIEYECLRGHRFIMSGPDSVLRGGSGIVRDSGSKVVFNDMPIYFPCPCRSSNVAQLMRVHIVTPKAPVNVILEPKVKMFQNHSQNSLTFTTGLPEPIKLSQSAYWILRLPFIYEGENGPLLPPVEVSPAGAAMHGVLLAGMYGIRESEISEDLA